MVKKFFFKDGINPRRLFKSDLVNIHIPTQPLCVIVDPNNGLYCCSLRGSNGDVLIMSSSADKLMDVVRNCYRFSLAAQLFNDDFYLSLTYTFKNV